MPVNVFFGMVCDTEAATEALNADIAWLTSTEPGDANIVGGTDDLSEKPVIIKTLPSWGPNDSTIVWSDVTTDTGDAAASKNGDELELSFPTSDPPIERISIITATLTNNCGASDIVQFAITTERDYFGSNPDNWSWSISVAEE